MVILGQNYSVMIMTVVNKIEGMEVYVSIRAGCDVYITMGNLHNMIVKVGGEKMGFDFISERAFGTCKLQSQYKHQNYWGSSSTCAYTYHKQTLASTRRMNESVTCYTK